MKRYPSREDTQGVLAVLRADRNRGRNVSVRRVVDHGVRLREVVAVLGPRVLGLNPQYQGQPPWKERKNMKKLIMVAGLLVGMGFAVPQANAATVYYEGYVNSSVFGNMSTCDYFPGTCGSIEIPPAQCMDTETNLSYFPQWLLDFFNYVMSAIGIQTIVHC